MRTTLSITILTFVIAASSTAYTAQLTNEKEVTNSIGMKFVRIEPGTFKMGQLRKLDPEVLPVIEGGGRGGRFDLFCNGDYDERPVHDVTITKPFYTAIFEVTNKQYELFDPSHAMLRGENDFSKNDDEAVVFVNFYQARAFCKWLSDIEHLPYRLPTEAEWEYACRAGTTTNYYTGDILGEEFLKQQRGHRHPRELSLTVGQAPPNPWGLYDMHGNVEEWCADIYGPYPETPQTDPVGREKGNFRVTRGGSVDTYPYFLRSANRAGALPADRNWIVGFRVVIGETPATKALPAPPLPLHRQNVRKRPMEEVIKGPNPQKPYFKNFGKFVRIPRGDIGPVFAGHNHNPAIAECPNGDLLACWYTCVSEKDRELAVAGARLRYGTDQWEQASSFWDTPDRNDHAPVLWYGDNGIIYHFQPFSVAATYATLAVAMRTSDDSGATWSHARIIIPEHGSSARSTHAGRQLSEPVFRMNDGAIAITSDGLPTLWMSHDEGLTWKSCGGNINGTHPGVTQLRNGDLLGFLRGNEVPYKQVITTCEDMGKTYIHKARKRRMAKCISSDLGKTWAHLPSPFPGLDGGQRLVLMRLRQGQLFFASFANRGMIITDAAGKQREIRGMFAALSEDDGKTWPYVKLVSDEGPGTPVMTTNGGYCIMSRRNAEYRGYMAGCQGLDGVINLISSYSHYAFNIAWLKTKPKPLKYPPYTVKPAIETFNGPDHFDLDGWEPYHGHAGGFNGKGQYTIISRSHFQGMNRLIGEGSFEMEIDVKNLRFNPRGPTSSPGLTIWIKDAMTRRLHFYVRDDRIDMGLQDEEEPAPYPKGQNVKYDSPPTSAKLRFIYDESKKQIRIFYGINGDSPTNELSFSKAGIFLGKAFSETTATYIMFSNGSVDLDRWQIKPINP